MCTSRTILAFQNLQSVSEKYGTYECLSFCTNLTIQIWYAPKKASIWYFFVSSLEKYTLLRKWSNILRCPINIPKDFPVFAVPFWLKIILKNRDCRTIINILLCHLSIEKERWIFCNRQLNNTMSYKVKFIVFVCIVYLLTERGMFFMVSNS